MPLPPTGGLKSGGVLPSVALANTKAKDTTMTYSSRLCLLLTTLVSAKVPGRDDANGSGPAPLPLEDHLQPALQQLLDLAAQFRAAAVSPHATRQFEEQ